MNPAFQPPADYTRREVEATRIVCACPFYGQSDAFAGRLVPRQGNRCALITTAHSPCWMEVDESRSPDWAACPRNPEFITEVIRGRDAEQRFNAHTEYMDQLRVQRGIALANEAMKQ